MEYDLENRTKLFSKSLLRLFRKFPIKLINENLVKQVLRLATSIGVNYCEANGAISKSDFKSKIYICKKEAKETLYWLDLIEEITDDGILKKELIQLSSEGKQLMLIFSKISSSLKI